MVLKGKPKGTPTFFGVPEIIHAPASFLFFSFFLLLLCVFVGIVLGKPGRVAVPKQRFWNALVGKRQAKVVSSVAFLV